MEAPFPSPVSGRLPASFCSETGQTNRERSQRQSRERQGGIDHYHFLEIEEVIGLVDEEELQSRPAEVVAAKMHFPELRQGALEVVADPWAERGRQTWEEIIGGSALT